MKPIQILLLLLLVGGLWVYLQFLRSRSRDRLFVVVVFIGGAVLVIWPDLASRLADQLGVGRGVDLVVYLAIMLLGFLNLVLYSHYRHLKQQLTQLVRHGAISAAEKPIENPIRGGDD